MEQLELFPDLRPVGRKRPNLEAGNQDIKEKDHGTSSEENSVARVP